MPNYDSLGPFQYIRALQKTGLYHMVISFIFYLFLSLFYFVRVILFALDHSTSAGVGGWGVFALVFTTHINFFDPYFMVKFRHILMRFKFHWIPPLSGRDMWMMRVYIRSNHMCRCFMELHSNMTYGWFCFHHIHLFLTHIIWLSFVFFFAVSFFNRLRSCTVNIFFLPFRIFG